MKKAALAAWIIVVGLVLVPVSPVLAHSTERVDVLISFRHAPGTVERALVHQSGGKIKQSYRLVPTMAASVPVTALSALRASPQVALLERDVKVQSSEQVVSWGISRIGAHPGDGPGGSGVRVAILDTGIDLDHPDLKVSGGTSFVSYASSADDDNGHGTHVAGIVGALDNDIGVVGVAPAAELYAVKVLDAWGGGYVSDVIAGLEWAVDHDMQVVNMSFGSPEPLPRALEEALDQAYAAGLLLVAAAGNSGPGDGVTSTVWYPARYDSVIAVSATDREDAPAWFSSAGPEVELAAPGAGILSTYRGDGYVSLSGTSMAAPHVTGAAALLISSGMKLNTEIRERLERTAHYLPAPSQEASRGLEMVDAGAAGYDLQAATAADITPPTATVSATPEVLWAPDHQPQEVVVRGVVRDEPGGSGVASVEITIEDEYGQVQTPLARLETVIILPAQRDARDRDGRLYTITLQATDIAGNSAIATATVTVPHDKGERKTNRR